MPVSISMASFSREGLSSFAMEDTEGARAGTGESFQESLSSSLSSEVSSTGSSCMPQRSCLQSHFDFSSVSRERRHSCGKLQDALQNLTLNTFRDPAGKALVESVKAILSGDGDARLACERPALTQASLETRSLVDELQATRTCIRQERSCDAKRDFHLHMVSDHRQGDVAVALTPEAQDLDEVQSACTEIAEGYASNDGPTNMGDVCKTSALEANLQGSSSSVGASSHGGEKRDPMSDPNMNDWQVWASNVSELLSTFSSELVSLGSRVDQVCAQLQAPKSESSTLPCILEETSVDAESEATVEASRMCDAADGSCEQRFAILSSRLDAIEESLKLPHFTNCGSQCVKHDVSISLDSDSTVPGDEFLELRLRPSQAPQDTHLEVSELCSFRPPDSHHHFEPELKHQVVDVERLHLDLWRRSLADSRQKQHELQSQPDMGKHERTLIHSALYEDSHPNSICAHGRGQNSNRSYSLDGGVKNGVARLDAALRPGGVPHKENLQRTLNRSVQFSAEA